MQKLFIAIFVLFASLLSSVNASACPCGYEGNNCSTLVPGVVEPLNGTCGAASQCSVNNGSAFCNCFCGSTGDYCEITRKGTTQNYAIGYGLLAAVFLIIFFYYRSRGESIEFKYVSADIAEPISSSVSRFMLLSWRIVAFAFSLFTFLYGMAQSTPFYGIFQAYTVWNFVFLIIYFGIGIYLSYKSLMGQLSEHDPMTRLQRIHVIMMEVELPCSLLVDVVVWTILWPSVVGTSSEIIFLRFWVIIQHSVNFFLMIIDFALTRYKFTPYHVIWMLLLPLFYALFHISRLLYLDNNGLPHCPIYPFLEMESPLFPAWVLGLMFVHMLFFFGAVVLSKCKPQVKMLHDLLVEEESLAGSMS